MGNKSAKNTNNLILTEPQIRLLEHNTGLTRSEIENWHKQFLTEYPDGSIDEKEFIQIFKKTYPNGHPEKYAKIAFKAFDEDKSGKISFEEFLLSTSFVTRGENDRQKALEFAFDIYDANKDGKISRKEMDHMAVALYELQGKDAKLAKDKVTEIFNKFDVDHNGSLDRYEFINFMLTDPICTQVFHL